MMSENIKVISGFFWRFAERCGSQGVSFLVSLILARLLTPDDYGTISLVMVFINILNVFVDSGMGNALIQKKNADNIDFSSVFYFNLLMCCILYGLIYVIAPYIALFYNSPQLTNIIRILSLTIIFSGIRNVQQAYVSRNMLFRRFFFATLGGTIDSAIVGIAMAYMGFGVWALVVQQIFNTAVSTIILWYTVKWRPSAVFSFIRLKSLFNFGWKLLVSGLINTIYENARTLIIGKIYSSEDLAYYNQGNKFPNVIVTNINNSIDSVLLPAMANEQEHINRVKAMTQKSIQLSTYIMAPLMMGLAVVADSVVSIVLTDKWLPCVLFLRIFCITYMFYPIHTANLNAINALGRSDIFLKLEIFKKIVGVTALIITMQISVEAMAYSQLIISIISQLANSWPNKKLLNYSYFDQVKDILPAICLSILMGVLIYPIRFLNFGNGMTLFVQIISGMVIYIAGSEIFKVKTFGYLKSMIISYLKRSR